MRYSGRTRYEWPDNGACASGRTPARCQWPAAGRQAESVLCCMRCSRCQPSGAPGGCGLKAIRNAWRKACQHNGSNERRDKSPGKTRLRQIRPGPRRVVAWPKTARINSPERNLAIIAAELTPAVHCGAAWRRAMWRAKRRAGAPANTMPARQRERAHPGRGAMCVPGINNETAA